MSHQIKPTHKIYKLLINKFKIVEINYSKGGGWFLETIDSTYFLGITFKECIRNIKNNNIKKQ